MADIDYGYGSTEDYGYGEASPDVYGYSEQDEDYGYGHAEPEPIKPVEQKARPKRRCSVTKFNLENSEALTAADRIQELRSHADDFNKSISSLGSSNHSSETRTKKDKTKSSKGIVGRLLKF